MNYLEKLTNTREKSRSMAAGISSLILEIRKDSIKQSLRDLDNVEHRQEYVGTIDGVMYYDDSRAENVNATWFTFENIVSPVVWIAGGDDRDCDFSELKPLVSKNVRALVCVGKNNKNLTDSFSGILTEIYHSASIEEAVKTASLVAKEDDLVLFSPACHSNRSKENFETRGNRFIASVKELENEHHQ